MTATKAGDHVLVSDSAYQPTRIFCDGVLKRFGVETQYYDPLIGAGIASLIRPKRPSCFAESPGSLSMEVQDIPAIADGRARHGASASFSTTPGRRRFFSRRMTRASISRSRPARNISPATPICCWGLSPPIRQWAKRLRATFDAFAMCAGPKTPFLALRGLRTMELRMREQERRWA